MNKVGLLLRQAHLAETRLAARFRRVSARQAAEHDVHYLCRTLAGQCDEQAAAIRRMARDFGCVIRPPASLGPVGDALDAVRRRGSDLLGRRPESGLLLLADLRGTYLAAERANVAWLALGQVAQVTRDQEFLDHVSELHKQTLTQVKWLKTRLREAVPQVVCA